MGRLIDVEPKIIKPCFCGGTEISVKKRSYNMGMDGYSSDWVFYCNKCKCERNYPADGFYGRDYYKTLEEVIDQWNKDHETIVNAIPKDQYEARLKADLVAMLEELDLRLCEQFDDTDLIKVKYVRQAIQEKINALKEDKDGNN